MWLLYVVVSLSSVLHCVARPMQPEHESKWVRSAKSDLNSHLRSMPSVKRTKNTILFIGDGMGPSTVTAARAYMAQSQGTDDVTTRLSFENFPFVGLSQTANSDRRVPDSAGTATALLCGEKVNFYTLGVTDQVKIFNCSNVQENKLNSILRHSIVNGKRTGLVTTTSITHATPAAAYARTANRGWEAHVPEDVPGRWQCPDIASQLITDPLVRNTRVLLGGGQSMFYPADQMVPRGNRNGLRKDSRNLIDEWRRMRASEGVDTGSYKYVTTKSELSHAKLEETDYLLGLFNSKHMDRDLDRQEQGDNSPEPSLTEMVEAAITVLDGTDEGFFLLVEGGNIDRAHHSNLAHHALAETVELSNAVRRAVQMSNLDETLIIVTADHSQPLSIVGYPNVRGDILGLFQDAEYKEPADDLPITILAYHNGPGWYTNRLDENNDVINRKEPANETPITRRNLTKTNIVDKDYVYDAGIPAEISTHSGEDVAVYATGSNAHLFTGVYQQHYIAHALMHAACVGDYQQQDHC